ncbi:MAG: hypothetical protein HY902_15165 [Deltaproteobacteria bacterium]|nr:hypothetical protein [Deltaproteobacteria bacterium]
MPQAPEPASIPAPPAAPAAPPVAATFDRVSCNLGGAVHGAMPPFGKLSMDGDVLIFEATSRVVTKTGALADDGSATLQSLGSVEMGQFRFEWPRASITGVEFHSQTATLHCDGHTYQIEGLGGHGAALKGWLVAQGVLSA